jgi:hypothetical protein
MDGSRAIRSARFLVAIAIGLATELVLPLAAPAQVPAQGQSVLIQSTPPAPANLARPPLADDRRPFAISLPAALQLGNANAVDIAAAMERLQVANA